LVYFQLHIRFLKYYNPNQRYRLIQLQDKFNIQKNILVAPLDWGLGHATRCIPIIRALIANGFSVFLAAEGAQAHLLQTEFPGLMILPLGGYHVRYGRKRWQLPWVLLAQLPRLLFVIKQERTWLEQIIKAHNIQVVLSDNRYGLSNQKVSCIFLTHQLTIKAPFRWLEKILRNIQYRYINRFHACWVPDAGGDQNLAGDLSHPPVLPKIPVSYLGLLSRFCIENTNIQYDYCILLSGPEPQRSLLEEKIIDGIKKIDKRFLLVRGKPGNEETINVEKHIVVKNHLNGTELGMAILQSNAVICRSGYTTLMEISALGKKALLIPTPGQTEQEYLAKKMDAQKLCLYVKQEELDCNRHFSLLDKFEPVAFHLPVFDKTKLSDFLPL